MYKELDNQSFDYVIIGTSLCESILSAYLTKLNKKILHLDVSKFYGGDCKNLSIKDMDHYLSEIKMNRTNDPHFSNLKIIKEEYLKDDFYQTEKIREYNFDFNPKFLYGKSKATDELSSSRASNYMEFVSVKKIYLHDKEKFLTIPCSKSEIFVSEDLQLFEKQKLLNFIYAVMKLKTKELDVNTTVDFKKDSEVENQIYEDLKNNLNCKVGEFLENRFSKFLQNVIKYVLANMDLNIGGNVPSHFTVDKMSDNIFKYLNSLQVYDVNPFIYPLYGSSEFSQALCRMSSVLGTVFIVNDSLQIELYKNNQNYIDNSLPKYVLNVNDINYNETFSIYTSNIIFNYNFLNSHDKLKIEETLMDKNKGLIEYFHQFISFYSIENNTNLRDHVRIINL